MREFGGEEGLRNLICHSQFLSCHPCRGGDPGKSERHRMVTGGIYGSLGILGTRPRMTTVETYSRHPRSCTGDLRQPSDVNRCREVLTMYDRHGEEMVRKT